MYCSIDAWNAFKPQHHKTCGQNRRSQKFLINGKTDKMDVLAAELQTKGIETENCTQKWSKTSNRKHITPSYKNGNVVMNRNLF